ncbi:hypothetical protein DL96DRAFT_1639877 [Flagelloscypha sp. PMI_526]|nr:hypothetical protein DL96DRAFT_1639877 [Flagelloscypha sp. PMI_526]
MSASDALSAVTTLYSIAVKVKDNKEELQRLIRRIEHVVRALEDTKRRDVIRDDEYNDALTAVFDLIKRSEKLSQRILKRSLGDRTWNAGSITAEIKSLNEDVQVYLNVHAIQALDIMHSSQSTQYSTLASSVQEIIVKLAELDVRLQSPSANQWPQSVQTSVLSNIASSDQQVTVSAISLPEIPSMSGSATQTIISLPKPAQYDVNIQLMSQSGRRTVALTGLRTPSKVFGEETVTVDANGDRPDWNHLTQAIAAAGFEVPDLLSETEEMRLTIVEGESTFDASAPEGLCISQHEPLRAWWSRYCDYHGVKFKKGDSFDDKRGAIASTPGCTRAELVDEGMAVLVAGVKLEFHRTFRVPDSEKVTQSLPPSLGRFPMVTVSEFASRLPEHIRARGGFLIPMFNREAMWIRFCREESKKAAVKISVGGVNALSGEIKTKSSPPEVQQDYVVSSKQPWLDGVRTSAGVVRQFVVSQLGEGYTVEEQVAGTATEGGFQFDVFPELHRAPVDKVFLLRGSLPRKRLMPGVGLPNDGEYRQDIRTPIRFTGRVGDVLLLELEYQGIQALPCQDPQWTYQEYRRRFDPSCTLHAVYKNREPEKFYKLSGIEPPKPNYAPGTLLVGGTGETAQQRKAAELAKYDQEAKMSGIAAGGKIIQKIYQDSDSPWIYDQDKGQRFHVHIVSPETWEKITGLLAPITPITPELYREHRLPWYTLYDNFQPDISSVSKDLAALKSVSTLDNVKHQSTSTPTSSKLVDPEHPGQCSTHFGQAVTCVFRPCGHRGCPGCLGNAMMNGSKCPHCNALISKFVGTKQPIPVVVSQTEGDDSEPDGPHWSVSVIEELAQQTRDRATVEFISYDPRERVSPLLGGPAGK